MTTLITADWHLSAKERDKYRHQYLSKLAELAKQAGVTRTFLLGDLTEEKDKHGDWLTNAVVDHVKRFAELGPVYIDQGNHDYQSDVLMPFFGFLRHIEGVRWIGRPTALTFKEKELGRVMFLPHTRNWKSDWDGMDFKQFNWIFAHNTFEGTDMGHGQKARGIPLSAFPRNAKVVSGDVHIPQMNGAVTYVGAPYLVDFGDDYQPRVLLVGNDGKLVSMKNKGPQKRLIEIAGVDNFDDVTRDLIAGDILKVRVHIRRKDTPRWPEMREAVRKWADKRGYEIHAVVPIIKDGGLTRATKRFEHVAQSDEAIVQEFAKRRTIDQSTLRAGMKML